MTAAATAPSSSSGIVRLRLGDVDRVRVRVAVAEYVSIFTILGDAIAGIRRGFPQEWRERVARAIPAPGHRAISPIGAAPSIGWIPDCLFPLTPSTDIALDGSVGMLRSAQPREVEANLAAEFGEVTPAPWRAAMDSPREWIKTCSDAVDSTAMAIRPLWNRARSLFDREIERVGIAAVHRSNTALLSTLNSRVAYADNCLTFTHAVGGTYDLAGRDLTLVPMISGDRMLISNFDDPRHVWIGYPVPGLGHLWSDGSPVPARKDPLTALLGPSRAVVLAALDRPATMGDLISMLNCRPNKATADCDRLEAAGLIRRQRQGRTIKVARTEAGTQVLHLYRP